MGNFKKIIGLILLGLTLWSCTKDNVLEIIDYGTLTFNITDKSDAPLSGATIYVFDFELFKVTSIDINDSYDLAIKKGETDANGKIDFGKLNTGLYLIYGVVEDEDNRMYQISKLVQIQSGEETKQEISLADYVGSVTIRVKGFEYTASSSTDKYLDTINVILVPYEQMHSASGTNFSEMLNQGIVLGKTDNSGFVSSEQVPIGRYYAIAYYDDTRYDILSLNRYQNSESYFEIQKGSKMNMSMYAEKEDLAIHTPESMSFRVYYTEYNTGTGKHDTTFLPDVNILLSQTSSSYLDNAISSGFLTMSTNDQGTASLEDISSLSSYYSYAYLWVYSDMNTYKRFGQVSFSSLKNKVTDLEVDKEVFYKTYGNVQVNAKGKYITGVTLDTLVFSNINLRLTTSSTTYFSNTSSYYDVKTDENGNATFTHIPTGTYYLWAYSDADHADRSVVLVTVVENETTNIEVVFSAENALILSGDLNFEFYGYNNGTEELIKDAYVIISKNYTSSVSTALNYAYKSGKTDQYGKITFKDLPVNEKFYVIVYYDADRYSSSSSSYTVRYKSSDKIRIQCSSRIFN
ncbi:hypothetical protein ACE01N_03020 [Saccharicrinis sp. FJH2]|uniref:hypothetical protein n=1 Tax=Saccharicrinis sp. FJH65 TaxID=3344659 RepID=UPI0035F448D0